MAQYAIMRVAKIKDVRGVVMALKHNTRENFPDNADPKRAQYNAFLGGSTLECMARYNERLPGKVRKNAVMAIELVMTASPTATLPTNTADKAHWDAYLNDCDRWALSVFGGKENLLHIAHHWDETTPHTHVIFNPIFEGKLNARHFIGGSRSRLQELQDDFYEKVGKKYQLMRGVSREETRAEHTHHKYYEMLKKEKELEDREAAVEKRDIELKDFQAVLNDVKLPPEQSRAAAVMGAVVQRLRERGVGQDQIKNFWKEYKDDIPANVDRIIKKITPIVEKKQSDDLTKSLQGGRGRRG